MKYIPDVGPLVLLVVIFLSACAKFYWARRNHNWLTFADGCARIGLALFYLTSYFDAMRGITTGSDQSRALARLGILAVFLIELMPWVIGFFRNGRKK